MKRTKIKQNIIPKYIYILYGKRLSLSLSLSVISIPCVPPESMRYCVPSSHIHFILFVYKHFILVQTKLRRNRRRKNSKEFRFWFSRISFSSNFSLDFIRCDTHKEKTTIFTNYIANKPSTWINLFFSSLLIRFWFACFICLDFACGLNFVFCYMCRQWILNDRFQFCTKLLRRVLKTTHTRILFHTQIFDHRRRRFFFFFISMHSTISML